MNLLVGQHVRVEHDDGFGDRTGFISSQSENKPDFYFVEFMDGTSLPFHQNDIRPLQPKRRWVIGRCCECERDSQAVLNDDDPAKKRCGLCIWKQATGRR